METKFPALRLCQGHWKVDALAIDIYSHWKRTYTGTATQLSKKSPRKRKMPVSSSDNPSSTKRPRLQVDLTTESDGPVTDTTEVNPTSAEGPPETEAPSSAMVNPAIPSAPRLHTNISTEPFKSQRFSAVNGAATLSSTHNALGSSASGGFSDTSNSVPPPLNSAIAGGSAATHWNPNPTPSESTAPIDANTGVRITPTENGKDDIPSNASTSSLLNCLPSDPNIDPSLLQELATTHARPPALPETPTNTSSIPPEIPPELQAAIGATKKNRALWLGSMRLNKHQDRAPRFRNDNSAEHLCGHEWKKTHEEAKTRDFVAYWDGLSDIDKYEWVKRSDEIKEATLKNPGKKIPKNANA